MSPKVAASVRRPSALDTEQGRDIETAIEEVLALHPELRLAVPGHSDKRIQAWHCVASDIAHVRGRTVRDVCLRDRVVTEGLATALERDFAQEATPWGDYPDPIEAWVTEVIRLPCDADPDEWQIRQPDGRRWVGIKVGTYLVDRATARPGRSLPDLAEVSSAALVAMALDLAGLLFGVTARDPRTFGFVACVFAVAASYVPARWALRHEPLDALRRS